MKARYLRKDVIEKEALNLLKSYENKYGSILQPPVPLEEILQNHLGLHFEICDLGSPDIMGCIDIPGKTISINEHLEPDSNPKMLGRYTYSIGHEIGHYTLHKSHVAEMDGNHDLLGERKPTILCRKSESKDPIEWQADYFSSCLIMPKPMIHKIWPDFSFFKKSQTLKEIYENEMGSSAENQSPEQLISVAEFVLKPMAELFNVSGQALVIRLRELELLQEHEDNQMQLV